MTRIILLAKLLFVKLTTSSLFIIKIENGIVTKVSGSVKNSFLNDCIEIVKRNDLKNGLIYANKSSYGTTILNASNEIKGYILQQLRNAWSFN